LGFEPEGGLCRHRETPSSSSLFPSHSGCR
jgi:hypothetical protein